MYIFGTQERIFINTNLGCKSNCSYCYLGGKLGIKKNILIPNKIPVEILIKNLLNIKYFKKGRNGTIISIGCYSECWDNENKNDTIKMILNIIPYGNYIQLATKRQIKIDDIWEIKQQILYEKQLNIYISNSTISQWDVYEKKTECPEERFLSFKLNKINGIKTHLYIKPYLPNITNNDIWQYIDIIKKYKIEVIVGKMFDYKISSYVAPIGDNKLFYKQISYEKEEEYKLFLETLKKYTNVYMKSTSPISTENKK